MANSQDFRSALSSAWYGKDQHNTGRNPKTAGGEAGQAGANSSASDGVRYNMGHRAKKVGPVSKVEDRARAWAEQTASAKRPKL